MLDKKMTDNEFAKWLIKQDKNWTYKVSELFKNITLFFCNNKLVAIVVFDNSDSTREIIINQQH